MNDYMRENKIESVAPQAVPAPAATASDEGEAGGKKGKAGGHG